MPRQQKISKTEIIEKVLFLTDKKGAETFTVQGLARGLGIKAPSLYNHVSGLSSLRQAVSARVHADLTEAIKARVGSKAGSNAIFALSKAYRQYAKRYPGRYRLVTAFPSRRSRDWNTFFLGLRDIFFEAFKDYGLNERDTRSAARALRSMLHGFVVLELNGGWSQVVDMDSSFNDCISLFTTALESKRRCH